MRLQIPKPCSQSWDEMTLENGGQYCTSCAKTVVDFTRMTDTQIQEALRDPSISCGRFRDNQLNRQLTIPPAKKRYSFAGFYKVAASLLLLFSAGRVAAQEKKEVLTEDTLSKFSQPISNSLSGIVTDNTGELLTGAQIVVDNYELTFISGIDGDFTMNIPDSVFERGGISISVYFPGYEGQSMFFRGEQFPLKLQVTLVRDSKELTKKGGFEILPIHYEETEKRHLIDIRKMRAPESDFVIGKMSFPASGNELRSKERELQYKQRENRLEEFIQDHER